MMGFMIRIKKYIYQAVVGQQRKSVEGHYSTQIRATQK